MPSSFNEFAFNFMLVMGLFLFVIVRIVKTVDDDGAIKDQASKGVASWIERWLK
jgi:hypothetical protein